MLLSNKTLNILIFLTFFPILLNGQVDSNRLTLVNNVCKHIEEFYFDKNEAKIISDSLKKNASIGKYDSIIFFDDFIWQLSSDLRTLSKQNHFNILIDYFKSKDFSSREYKNSFVFFIRNKIIQYKRKVGFESYLRRLSRENIHFAHVDILPGNVGYIEIKNFNTKANISDYKRIKISRVIKRLRKTSSIIIDLRDNQGGNVNQVANLISYFTSDSNEYYCSFINYTIGDSNLFDREDMEKSNLFVKRKNRDIYKNKIYVLTSRYTISSGELATYFFKTKCNSITIGQQTAGAGSGIGMTSSFSGVSLYVPSVRIIDTLNNYSFHTSQVLPDIVVNSDSAFILAYKMALVVNQNQNYSNNETISIGIDSTLILPFKLLYDFGRVKLFSKSNILFLKYDYNSMEEIEIISENIYKSKHYTTLKLVNNNENQIQYIELKRIDGKIERFKIKNLSN